MSVVAVLGQPTCSVPSPRWLWVATGTASKIRSISSGVEPVGEQPLARARLHETLRARARGHALGAHADQAPRAGLGGHRGAEQRVELLRLDPETGAGLCSG